MRNLSTKFKLMVLKVFGRRSVGYYLFAKMLVRFLFRKIISSTPRPKNILIIALGRSGTTWISNAITDFHHGENFGEILQFRPPMVAKYLSLSSSASLRATSVIKILTYQLKESGINVSQLSAWYNKDIDLIVTIRRDELEQIASVIYSKKVGLWHRTEASDVAPSISVSKDEFDAQFHWSRSQEKILNSIVDHATCPIREIAYEDFDASVLASVFDQTFTKGRPRSDMAGIYKRDVKKINSSGVAGRIDNWAELQLWYQAGL